MKSLRENSVTRTRGGGVRRPASSIPLAPHCNLASKVFESGFTLVELVVVLAILVILAGMALLRSEGVAETAEIRACDSTMLTLRDAILGAAGAPGYRSDVGDLPGSLADLLRTPPGLPVELQTFDPVSERGWNGPYLAPGLHSGASDPTVLDPWLTPIVLQIPGNDSAYARLVSAGSDRIFTTNPNAKDVDPSSKIDVGDDRVLFLTHIPGTSP